MRVIIGVCLISLLSGCSSGETLKIGAILPLTGPVAINGEMIKGGMELAKIDLEQQGITLEIIYEDSQGTPTQGLSAYNKLKNIDNVDVVLVAFSRVAMPLIPLADQDEIPILMTLVAAYGAADKSPYAFRFFSSEEQFAHPHFNAVKKGDTLGLLYIDDEYGHAVGQAVKEKAEEMNIQLTEETYDVGATDFRTQLLKIKVQEPDGIFVVVDNPPAMINLANQVKELGIQATIFEASPYFAAENVRKAVGEAATGMYTITYSKKKKKK